jgi:outer membrane protein assembly factor BamB
VFFSSGYDRGCALAEVGAASESAVLWRKDKLRTVYNTFIYENGYLFGFAEDEFKCIEFNTGKEIWSESFEYIGSQIKAGDKYILLSEKGEIFTARVSERGYEQISTAKVMDGRCWTLPTLCNGLLYVRNSLGHIICLDMR